MNYLSRSVFFSFTFIVSLTICSVYALQDYARNLSCYQCQVNDESLCTEDFLKPCPEDQAYDRCLTMENKGAKGLEIFKSCALAPCSLRNSGANEALGLDNCDRYQPSYSCVMCCKEDGCNISTGSSPFCSPNNSVVVLLALLAIITTMPFFRNAD